MAKYLVLDKRQYGTQGLIPLRRGDDWELVGQVQERYAGYQSQGVDLTGTSATGYFPNATGGLVAATVDIQVQEAGTFKVSLDKALTPEVAESPAGSSFFLVLEKAGELETVETQDEPLEILDRGFRS